MTDDPIIAEVRRHRDEHAASFNYDLHAIVADLRKSQEARGATAVRLPKRRAPVKNTVVAK